MKELNKTAFPIIAGKTYFIYLFLK